MRLILSAALLLGAAHAEQPVYMEEGHGETSLWLDFGGVGWFFTERDPLATLAPVALGVGVAHRIGQARLGSRVHVFLALGDKPTTLLYGDLLAVEQVLAQGTWRPFWRLALGFGLDLEGVQRGLGEDGYFNAANGPTGGIGVGHAWGVEVLVSSMTFLRLEADARVFGGAGRTQVMAGGHLGVGVLL